jgi:hypothetical protein
MMYRKWLKANEVRNQGQAAEAGIRARQKRQETGPFSRGILGSKGRNQGQPSEAGNRAGQQKQETGPGSRGRKQAKAA